MQAAEKQIRRDRKNLLTICYTVCLHNQRQMQSLRKTGSHQHDETIDLEKYSGLFPS